jgi:hypothetical protein
MTEHNRTRSNYKAKNKRIKENSHEGKKSKQIEEANQERRDHALNEVLKLPQQVLLNADDPETAKRLVSVEVDRITSDLDNYLDR